MWYAAMACWSAQAHANFCDMSNIQGRVLYLGDFEKKMLKINLQSDAYELNSRTWYQCKWPWPSFKVTGLRDSWYLWSHVFPKWHKLPKYSSGWLCKAVDFKEIQ